jgi:hypothetical protein
MMPRHGRRGAHENPEAEDAGGVAEPSAGDQPEIPSPFPHPPWTVNLVLVAGVITVLFGVLVDPVWLLVGSPFVLVLLLWLYVRLSARR